jgi:hypothetical protein
MIRRTKHIEQGQNGSSPDRGLKSDHLWYSRIDYLSVQSGHNHADQSTQRDKFQGQKIAASKEMYRRQDHHVGRSLEDRWDYQNTQSTVGDDHQLWSTPVRETALFQDTVCAYAP